jgi:hypothetical protein
MFQLVNRIPDDQVIGVMLGGLGIVCGTAVILTAIAARCWTRHRQRQVAEPLIRDMLARGMSGDEIAAVLATAFEVGPARRRSLHEVRQIAQQHEDLTT